MPAVKLSDCPAGTLKCNASADRHCMQVHPNLAPPTPPPPRHVSSSSPAITAAPGSSSSSAWHGVLLLFKALFALRLTLAALQLALLPRPQRCQPHLLRSWLTPRQTACSGCRYTAGSRQQQHGLAAPPSPSWTVWWSWNPAQPNTNDWRTRPHLMDAGRTKASTPCNI